MKKEDLLLVFLGILTMLCCNRPIKQKDIPGCFPDYRPGFKCMAWEKLPY